MNVLFLNFFHTKKIVKTNLSKSIVAKVGRNKKKERYSDGQYRVLIFKKIDIKMNSFIVHVHSIVYNTIIYDFLIQDNVIVCPDVMKSEWNTHTHTHTNI